MNRITWRKLARLSWVVLVLGTAIACAGTGSQAINSSATPELKPVSLAAGERLRVVATTNIVGDVVGRVGGEHIALETLMGAGVDPHSYVPTPADTAAVHDAHAVFANGLGLEAFLETMIQNAGSQGIEIHLADGLKVRPLPGEPASAEPGHSHDNGDPHVWFDVQNTIKWVETIRDTLSALDPANAQVFAANASNYAAELEQLDAWIAAQVATIPEANRKLVTNHPAFGYFADRYGFEQIGTVYPISPSSEPSARDIAALEDIIRQHDVPAVFTESTVNPRLAQQVAQDTGVKLVQLYTGSLGGPGSGVESYVALMRYDLNAIVGALR